MIRARRQRGFNLIEVAIVLAILSVMVLTATLLTRATDESYQSTVQSSNATFQTRRALERMTEEIRRSDELHVTVDHSGFEYDFVEVELPLTVDDGNVIWGASSRTGWKIQYLVEDDTLMIRRVVNAGGIIMEMDQVLTTSLDDDPTTGKGFAVTKNGSLFTISVRVVVHESGREWSRQLTTAVSLRN